MDFRPNPEQSNDPQENELNEKEEVTRRDFLKALGVSTAGTLAFGGLIEYLSSDRESESEIHEGVQTEFIESGRRKIETGKLSDHEVNDLFKVYLGLDDEITGEPARIESSIDVDFSHQLDRLWELKSKDKYGGINNVAKETGEELLSEYNSAEFHTGMRLADYQKEADNVSKILHDRIDWKALGDGYGLAAEKVDHLEAVAETVGGDELLAYALTELMPSEDGELNADVLEFLLKHAGREYVDRIPAIYDDLTSFGPYQMTSNALYAVGDDTRGASNIDRFTDEDGFSGSVANLRGADHHKAAYLFSMHNLTRLMKGVDTVRTKELADKRTEKQDDIAQFIAAAHNFPNSQKNMNGALESGRLWLANDMQAPYWRSCDEKPLAYAKRSHENYTALQQRREEG